MGPLHGRTALITGGGQGIGADTARVLAEAGATVTVVARTLSRVEAVAEQLRDDGAAAYAFACDVTDPQQVEHAVEEARSAMGRVDILVNNAGAASSNPLGRVTLGEWNRMFAVNATGTFLCTRAVVDAMVARGWGRVVNVASVAGLEGARYVSAYTAAKHAVMGFTRAVAAEVAGTGVTVNAVCPAYVDTPMTGATLRNIMERKGVDRAAALEMVLGSADQERLVTGREVGRAVLALCVEGADGPSSPSPAPVPPNGEAIVLDGSGPPAPASHPPSPEDPA